MARVSILMCSLALSAAGLFGTSSTRAQSNLNSDSSQQTQTIITIQSANAERNLVKRVSPLYPSIAKLVHVRGDVDLEVVISKDGTVSSVKVLSGDPMLVQAAVEAVKQWQYKPFVADGQPVEARTEVKIPFSLGIPDADYKTELEVSKDYFNREGECRNSLKARHFSEAENSCKSSVELSEKLPKDRQLERMEANGLAGQAFLAAKEYDEALSFFQREVAIGKTALGSNEAELGYAYHHVAVVYHATGSAQQAELYYGLAESTLEKARENKAVEIEWNNYAKVLESVLQHHILLLQQTGQTAAAAKLQQRLDHLVQ
jgi:TonB family protein